MWDWLFGSGDGDGYTRYMSSLYNQNLENQLMCCTYHCDLCYKQVKLGEQKIHSLGNFCAECYNYVGRVQKLMARHKEMEEKKAAAALAAAACVNQCRNEDKEEIARLRDHVSKLQNMIVNMTKV